MSSCKADCLLIPKLCQIYIYFKFNSELLGENQIKITIAMIFAYGLVLMKNAFSFHYSSNNHNNFALALFS